MQAGCDMRIDRGIVFVLTVLLPASIQGAAEEAAGDAMQEQEETEQAVRESAEEGSSAKGGPSRSPAEGSSHARGAPSRSPAEGSPPARGAPSRSPAEGSPPEVFLPTEEISEDYAAPFPVDI